MKKLIAIGSLAVLLGGCATSYKDSYGQSRMSSTVFNINTVANGFAYIGQEDDFAMLRAAEIACVEKYRYFDVVRWQHSKSGQINYATLTIELKEDDGKFDAPVIMKNLKVKLDTDTDCSF